ncbi:MAG: hypothetical protein IPK59_06855 [Rhodospirillaceae bacterium]|nr:hypothetical protein [Rhodospirillaceae bacterium]
MHLRDARVDLDGNVIASGRMIFASDNGGVFAAQECDQVQISRLGPLRVVACKSRRDSDSGFLVSEAVGPALSFPDVFATVIRRACWLSPKEAIVMSLGHQDGALASSVDRDAVSQPLSDWKLEVEAIEGAIHVRASAALRATLPFNLRNKDIGSYWSSREETERISVTFSVDPVTRTACFGSYTGVLSDKWCAGDAVPARTSLQALRLDTAPVGPFNEMGPAAETGWIKVQSWFTPNAPSGQSVLALIFNRVASIARTESGFLASTDRDSGQRSIWFEGINLVIVADLMRHANTMKLSLTDGISGYLWDPSEQRHFYDMDISPTPEQHFLEATISFALTARGLECHYRIHVNDLHVIRLGTKYQRGWIEDSVTLPWELLILRHPQFLQRRESVAG